jgi:hypothetical protein
MTQVEASGTLEPIVPIAIPAGRSSPEISAAFTVIPEVVYSPIDFNGLRPATRNISFRLAKRCSPSRRLCVSPVGKRNGLALDPASCLEERLQRRRASKALSGRLPARWRHNGLPGPLREATQNGGQRATQSRKTLRKSALKSLKKLARANLARAPTSAQPYDWSKLAFGPASASALPTSRPKSSIEVSSRTERSSPFACRSACSAERATLTVTFASTSGCR